MEPAETITSPLEVYKETHHISYVLTDLKGDARRTAVRATLGAPTAKKLTPDATTLLPDFLLLHRILATCARVMTSKLVRPT